MGCGTSFAVARGPVLTEVDFHTKYQLGMKLGAGNFGQVRLATTSQGSTYAAKILHFTSTPGGWSLREAKETFYMESALWQKSQESGVHPNVVEFFEAFGSAQTYYIVMEACKCSVLDGLKGEGILMEDLSRLFREMALGLAHVHAARVVHRDVKPDNFLLGGPDGKMVKLTDFGLAAAIPKKGVLMNLAGTAPYMSPEVLGSAGYGEKTDVWSMGVTAYVMLFGNYPYMPKMRNAEGMKALIRSGSPAPSFKPVVAGFKVPDLAVDFVKSALKRSEADRPLMADLPKMAFLKTAELPQDSKELESQSLGEAWKVTQSYKKKERPVDPTVQNSLDDLLQRLQENHRGQNGEASSSWFSEVPTRTFEPESSQSMEAVAAGVRRKSRHSTHSGLSTLSTSNMLDNDSSTECSTAATRSPLEPIQQTSL